jgi:hypothetical protein
MLPHFVRRPTAAVFHHPLDPAPRTAILIGGFQSNRSVRVFPAGWSEAVSRYRPAAIAAPLSSLRELAGRRGRMELAHSVVVFTYDPDERMDAEDRDLLWHAFGVPVFEQYLNSRNELLATECEAHAGLHIVNGCGGLETEKIPCPCGSGAPRLKSSRVMVPDLEPALA